MNWRIASPARLRDAPRETASARRSTIGMKKQGRQRQQPAAGLEDPPADEAPLAAAHVLEHQQGEAAERQPVKNRNPINHDGMNWSGCRTTPRPPMTAPIAADDQPAPLQVADRGRVDGRESPHSHLLRLCSAAAPVPPAAAPAARVSAVPRPECRRRWHAGSVAARGRTRRSPSDPAARSARDSPASRRTRWSSRRRSARSAPPAGDRRGTTAAGGSRGARSSRRRAPMTPWHGVQ